MKKRSFGKIGGMSSNKKQTPELSEYLHKLPLTKAVTAPYRRNEPSDLEYALLICTAHFRFYT